jgi:multiple sugar transport system permease protein
MSRRSVSNTLTGLAWVSPWLIGAAAFMFVPMALSLYFSFTDYSMLEPPLWVGLENYQRMLSDPELFRSVKNTLYFSAISIPLTTVFALVLAALLSGGVRFGRFFQAMVFIPTLVPLVAAAMVWSWLFNAEFGLVNQALRGVGITGPNWLLDPAWAVPALVVMNLWSVGQSVVVYVAALQDVPRHLYEAAELDGMGPVRRFWNVTVPMISPAILFNVITLAINTVQVFAAPYIMFRTKDGQNPGGLFYTMYLYDNGFTYLRMGYASAMAWVLLIITMLLTGLMFWASRRMVYYRAN